MDKLAKVRAEVERLKHEALQKKSQGKRSGLERIMHQIGAYNKVLSFIDSLQEEPKFKTGDRIKPVDSCLGSPRTIVDVCNSWYVTDQGTLDFEYEDNWKLIEEPVSEDLEETIDGYTRKVLERTNCLIGNQSVGEEISKAVKFGAEWQKEKHERQFSFINLKDCKDAYNEWKSTQKEPVSAALSWVRACRWQKQQDQETIELAEDHAMLAGMEKTKEQMLKDAVDGFVIEDIEEGNGDFLLSADYLPASMGLKDRQKVKVIILKDE